MNNQQLTREIEALESALFLAKTERNPNQMQINSIMRQIWDKKEEQIRQIQEEGERIREANTNMRRAMEKLREREER